MRVKIGFLMYLLLSLSFISYAQPPIELAYFKPSDIPHPSQEDTLFIYNSMIEVQKFFASEMDRHGYGPKTFEFSRDIGLIRGKKRSDEYFNPGTIYDEFYKRDWRIKNKVDVFFVAGRPFFEEPPAAAVSGKFCWVWPGSVQQPDDCNYAVLMPAKAHPNTFAAVLAHEILHAFELSHAGERLLDEKQNIMFSAFHVDHSVKSDLKDFAITDTDAAFLNSRGRLTVQENLLMAHKEIDTDVNNDGYVDLSDVLIVRSAIKHKNSYDTDVNGDGITNEIDVLLVKQKAMEAIVAAAPSLIRRKKITTWGALKQE